MWQSFLLRSTAAPLAIVQPPTTSQQLLIQNRPSGSNDSAISVPGGVVPKHPPLLVEQHSPTPPLPSKGDELEPTLLPLPEGNSPQPTPLHVSEDDAGEPSPSVPHEGATVSEFTSIEAEAALDATEEPAVGHNLHEESSEAGLGSGADPADDPPAGCAQ